MAGNKIIKIMQKTGKASQDDLTDLVYGQVLSINPLKIKVDNRFEITSNFIILSALAKEKKITIGDTEIILWRGLQTNDKVKMLKVNQGQKYYVIEREGNL